MKRNPERDRENYLLNPLEAERNGGGLGAFLGSLIGAVPGLAFGSKGLAYLGNVIGGAVGGHMAGRGERKQKAAIGGAAGAAVFGPFGAALGGWIGDKPKKRNPAEAIQKRWAHQNPVQFAADEEQKARDAFGAGNVGAALGHWAAAMYYEGRAHQNRAHNPCGDCASHAVQLASQDCAKAKQSSERALQAIKAGDYKKGVHELGATAYYVGAAEAHMQHDPGGDHTEIWVDGVGGAARNAMQAFNILNEKAGGRLG